MDLGFVCVRVCENCLVGLYLDLRTMNKNDSVPNDDCDSSFHCMRCTNCTLN